MRPGALRRLALAHAVPVLALFGGNAAAQAAGRLEIVFASFHFEAGERTLSAEARSAIDAAVARMDAMCGKDWGERSWGRVSYRVAGKSWPRGDMQLIGERMETMQRQLMHYAPRSWSMSFSASEGQLDWPMPAGRDHIASIAMYCGL